MSPRVRLWVSGGATALILAMVIFGLWAFTAPSSKPTVPPTISLSPAQQSQNAYKDGMDALSKDQTGTAIAFFEKALSLDPKNADAQKALDNAKKSSSNNTSTNNNGSSTSHTATVTPAPVGAWDKKVALKSVLPTSFPDFTLGHTEQGSKTDADVSANPLRRNAVATIVWSVHDQGTAAKAAKFLANVTKKLYTKDSAVVAVNDVANAYFGTDGSDFACVAYTRGHYVFEVILTSQQPATAKDLATQAAAAFPIKP